MVVKIAEWKLRCTTSVSTPHCTMPISKGAPWQTADRMSVTSVVDGAGVRLSV